MVPPKVPTPEEMKERFSQKVDALHSHLHEAKAAKSQDSVDYFAKELHKLHGLSQ